MGLEEKILTYLSVYGKTHKYKIARELKTDVSKITKALNQLREEGNIEIKSGNAILVKGKKPITRKAKKRKKPKVKEEQLTEEPEEEAKAEVSEEPTEEKAEEVEEKPSKEEAEEERVEGTVKFYNPNKGFGFITGDDGKDYYVHESSLKEGVKIEADDRVSFKIVQGEKGPKAEEVEKIDQSMGEEKQQNAS